MNKQLTIIDFLPSLIPGKNEIKINDGHIVIRKYEDKYAVVYFDNYLGIEIKIRVYLKIQEVQRHLNKLNIHSFSLVERS